MRLAEFFERMQSQPERTVRGLGLRFTPEMLAKTRRPGGVRLSEMIGKQDRFASQAELRFRHVVAPPASEVAIAAWQAKRPSYLLALVRAANGIDFWANTKTGDRYTGLAPIEEWEIARVKMYGPSSSDCLLDDRYLAISYDIDGGSFIVVDTLSGRYYSLETSGPDTSSPIAANNLEELLEWLWKYRGLPPGTTS